MQDLIAGWTDVEPDGIRCVRRYPRLRQGERVQPMIVDDVVEISCSQICSSRYRIRSNVLPLCVGPVTLSWADVEHAKGQGVAWCRAGDDRRSRVELHSAQQQQ